MCWLGDLMKGRRGIRCVVGEVMRGTMNRWVLHC